MLINNDEKLKTITLVGNILLWVLLLLSIGLATATWMYFGSISKLQAVIVAMRDTLLVINPFVILAGAITSLILRKNKKYFLSLIAEIIPFGLFLAFIYLCTYVY